MSLLRPVFLKPLAQSIEYYEYSSNFPKSRGIYFSRNYSKAEVEISSSTRTVVSKVEFFISEIFYVILLFQTCGDDGSGAREWTGVGLGPRIGAMVGPASGEGRGKAGPAEKRNSLKCVHFSKNASVKMLVKKGYQLQ